MHVDRIFKTEIKCVSVSQTLAHGICHNLKYMPREGGIVVYNVMKSSWVFLPLTSSLCQIAVFFVCMFGMQSKLD